MDGKLRMPETATYIPICRTVEAEETGLPPGKNRRRGVGRVLLGCTLIFACALAINRPDVLQTVRERVLNLQPVLETLGMRTREAVQAFAGLQEEAEAVWNAGAEPQSTTTATGAPVQTSAPAYAYYGESPVPDFAVIPPVAESTAAVTSAVTTTTAAAAERIVYSDPDECADWPEIVTASVTVPQFDYTMPVSGTITSDFGYRDHPVDGEVKFHYGVDIAAAEGTPIGAFADGTVIYAGIGEINGNYIKIRHDDGYVSLYAHMSETCVEWGQTVKKGELVGKVGQTGTVTGPHLHLQLYHDGLLFDPVLLLGDSLGA